MYAIIGTWEMSLDGVTEAGEMLARGASCGDAAVHAVMRVEDEPAYSSVGYGALPDRTGHIFCDAAYMDGNTLRFGAIMSAENIGNPVLAARALCGRKTNCLLAGRGAEEFAIRQGIAMRDMRTEASLKAWREKLAEELPEEHGHDTVCVIALDEQGKMCVATSTSGLFMKEPGRVGDTPIIGSGFYCDAEVGGAAATGMGEEIMRGCLSREIVRKMAEGMTPDDACRTCLDELIARTTRAGDPVCEISVIALSKDGIPGAASTLEVFPYAAGRNEKARLVKKTNGTEKEEGLFYRDGKNE